MHYSKKWTSQAPNWFRNFFSKFRLESVFKIQSLAISNILKLWVRFYLSGSARILIEKSIWTKNCFLISTERCKTWNWILCLARWVLLIQRSFQEILVKMRLVLRIADLLLQVQNVIAMMDTYLMPGTTKPVQVGILQYCLYLSNMKGSNVFSNFPDIDECQQEGFCSHECTNTAGSYKCSCKNGYELVNRTCKAKGNLYV